MTSKENGEPLAPHPAEGASSTDAERLYGCNTPLPDKYDANDWESFAMRKHLGGTQSAYGVLRNDRTPLNTPYTPAVVKLQLCRLDESESREGGRSMPRAVAETIAASACHLMQPLRYIQTFIDRTLTRVLPGAIANSGGFSKHRHWIAWYLTTVVSIPLVLLLSPMVIAFCICTSPIWIAGVGVLLIRAMIPSAKLGEEHQTQDYVHSPHRLNGARVNGVTSSSNGHHHAILHRRGNDHDHE